MVNADWPLLAGLSEQDRAELQQRMRRRTFRRGEVVFHRDDPADTVHFVAKGRFGVRIVTPLGDTVTLAIVGRGQTFGELALVSPDARRSATVFALEAGETRSLLHDDFARLRARNPAASEALVALLAEQVQRLSRLLVEALHLPADQRVVRRVADLAAAYAGDAPDGPVEIPLTQEDIAGLAGTARATVNRVLRGCEERGLVELRRGRTVVVDRQGLAEHARTVV